MADKGYDDAGRVPYERLPAGDGQRTNGREFHSAKREGVKAHDDERVENDVAKMHLWGLFRCMMFQRCIAVKGVR